MLTGCDNNCGDWRCTRQSVGEFFFIVLIDTKLFNSNKRRFLSRGGDMEGCLNFFLKIALHSIGAIK
jgi:hypothetical protein